MGGNHSANGGTVMRKRGAYWIVVSVVVAGLGVFGGAQPFAGDMSFFVSSAGSGKGADLGGLEGADRICKTLAEAAGAGGGRGGPI